MKCPILVDFPCCHVRNINVHEGFKYISDLSSWTDEIVLTGDYETLCMLSRKFVCVTLLSFAYIS